MPDARTEDIAASHLSRLVLNEDVANKGGRAEAVFQALREALQRGDFKPGDRLREEEIAQQLSVSRTPVRDAFGRLQARRLVEMSGRRGLVVRVLERGEIFELYAMREILEGAAARLAAQNATDPEIAMMRKLEEDFETPGRSPRDRARSNRLFHEYLVTAARNRYLDTALEDLRDGIALLGETTFAIPGRPDGAAIEHRAMLDAIAARNPDEAEHAARVHIKAALEARLGVLARQR